MAVTHDDIRDAIGDFVVDQLDAGTLVLLTSGDVEVATMTFGSPAFGATSSGVATANAITPDSSATGGVIAKAQMKDTLGNVVVAFSITGIGGGGDVEVTDTTIAVGQYVEVASLTYEACP